MQSYLLGQYEKSMPHSMSLREKLLLSRKCGFDYLEISVDETDEKLSRLDWGKGAVCRKLAQDGRLCGKVWRFIGVRNHGDPLYEYLRKGNAVCFGY